VPEAIEFAESSPISEPDALWSDVLLIMYQTGRWLMAKITCRVALNQAVLVEEMARDSGVFILGEDFGL
jgi:hypothetical protein